MKSFKYILFILIVSVLVLVLVNQKETNAPESLNSDAENSISEVLPSEEELNLGNMDLQELNIEVNEQDGTIATTFTGILEEIDTSCFADGECFAIIDGKHVTTIEGWKEGALGKTIITENPGAGFGDLDAYIGQEVEVYAAITKEGKFSLYGSEDYYIKTL
jgi:hypothetical protein